MTPDEVKKSETERLEFKREGPRKDNRSLQTVVAFANRFLSGFVDGAVVLPPSE